MVGSSYFSHPKAANVSCLGTGWFLYIITFFCYFLFFSPLTLSFQASLVWNIYVLHRCSLHGSCTAASKEWMMSASDNGNNCPLSLNFYLCYTVSFPVRAPSRPATYKFLAFSCHLVINSFLSGTSAEIVLEGKNRKKYFVGRWNQ